MSYSTACDAQASGKLKGTGRNGNAQAGAVTKMFWSPNDFSFASKEDAVDIDAWNTGVAAGNLYYIGEISEMDANDTEATYYEAQIGNQRIKTAETKRVRQYRLIECACTHAALLSFDGQNGRIFFQTDSGYVKGRIEEDGSVRGLKTSQFDVGIAVEATPETPAFTPIDVTFETPRTDDINAFEDTIDWDFIDVDQIFNAEFKVNTVASNGSNLTFNVVATKDCSNVALGGIIESQISIKDANGSEFGTYTWTESGTAGTYAVDVTTAETVAYVSIDGVQTVSSVLYVSDEVKASV